MRGVTFGDKHSYRDFGLYLNLYPVSVPPEPLSKLVEVPGKDGFVNLSTALDGFMHYKQRDLKLQFVYIGDRDRWFDVMRDFSTAVHGKELDIYLDDDPGYRYHGLVTVGTPSYSRKHDFIIPVTAVCDSYKYEATNSVDEEWLWDDFSFEMGVIREYGNMRVDGERTIDLIGCKRPCYPDIITMSDHGEGFEFVYEDISLHLDDGVNIIAGMPIVDRPYFVTFKGHGTVSIEFECGVL